MFSKAIISLLCLLTMAYTTILPRVVQAEQATSRLGNATAAATRLGNATLATREPPAYFGSKSWAEFCDDDNCSENCGQAVQMGNPGCLNQHKRRSIRMHGHLRYRHHLVVSPGSGCNCQVRCERVKMGGRYGNLRLLPMGQGTEFCWNIAAHGYDEALSFRFLAREQCGLNQCNWDGTSL